MVPLQFPLGHMGHIQSPHCSPSLSDRQTDSLLHFHVGASSPSVTECMLIIGKTDGRKGEQ